MLRYAPKGEVSAATLLGPEEDRLLREGFGHYSGRPEARAAAAAVVARYQQRGMGCWFHCDCRPGAQRPPALVPVAQSHIRRHQDARWPVHCEFCDFYRDPEEQRAITVSYARAQPRPLRLARPFATKAMPMEQRLVSRSLHTSRPSLARLLVRLITDAGLQEIGPNWRQPTLVDQAKAIWAAAKSVELDAGVRLTGFLCTSPGRLGEIVERIATAPARQFAHTRPHGVLIARVAAIGAGVLEPIAGPPIRVRGRLAVFAEHVEHRETRAERAARAPYLAICVLGRASDAEPVEVLSAYAHPCAADQHLMLVDSALERETLARIRSVQLWFGRKKQVPVAIEKPLFDLGPEDEGGAESRPPCIPDFIVRAGGVGGAPAATAIVETMGYVDAGYRARKQRTHSLMRRVLQGTPIVAHDFHEPADQTQRWRDDRFWHDLRGVLIAAEPERVTSPRSGIAVSAAAAPPV